MNKVALFAILGTAMFLLSGATAFAATPSTGTVHIQPNPTLNTNITWSTFYNGWNVLEYSNGTGNQTLNTGLSNIYKNPISVNPVDLQSTYLTNSNTTGTPFNSSKIAVAAGASGGSVQTTSYANGIYTLTQNTSASATNGQGWYLPGWISDTHLPSNNMAFNYITIAYSLSGPTMTGVNANLAIWNGSDHSADVANTTIYPGQSIWESVPLSDFSGANFNTTVSSQIEPELSLGLPEHASTTYTIKLSAFTITDTPLYLGSNASGPKYTSIDPKFSTFNPDFPWQDIDSSGYSVAISQPLQNLTTTQTPISSGNYIEQVEYQGLFDLPTAPDLSYGAANLTEQFNVSTAQTQVLDINGVSYLSTISGKNGTIQLLSPVNPNSQTQFLQIVDYTESQWNSISVAPGIFTIAGIEYYWWIAVGGLATLIGLAAAAKHAGTKADQERIRRGR